MSKSEQPDSPLKLTHARRRLIAELLPDLADRLKTDEAASRTIRFTAKELRKVVSKCKTAQSKAGQRKIRDALEHIGEAAAEALERHKEGDGGQIPASARLYQFKITLRGIKPPIWRRIQIKDCALDKLHEHIQAAMGWTNSHLHQFTIDGIIHGDPALLCEGWSDEEPLVNSRRTKLSKIIPGDCRRFRFNYEYDFGDGWEHEILFEGCLRAEQGTPYPLCVDGKRACPPEDVGGIYGYQGFLEAMADPAHVEHESFLEWNGPFDAEAFDNRAASRSMREGLPNWREEG